MRLCDLDEIKICVDRQYENCHGYSGSKKAIYREAILAVKSILHSAKPINAVTVQEWIPVTDRLPDKDGCYIVTACDEGCSCGDGIWYDTVVIEAEHYKGEWSWNENGTEYDITDLVTHWMPMPAPPKGE